jgi:hypothetical protein
MLSVLLPHKPNLLLQSWTTTAAPKGQLAPAPLQAARPEGTRKGRAQHTGPLLEVMAKVGQQLL